MKTYDADIKPASLGYYTKELKRFIPTKAFKPATYKLIPMSIHFIVAFLYYTLIAKSQSNISVALYSILAGFSIACLFTFCHELTHNTIVKQKTVRYVFELLFWSLSGMPPTLWDIIHNRNHHKNTNNYNDPDRRTFKSEKNRANFIYNLFIYPNKALKYSITVGFAMIFYTIKHIISVFYLSGKKPSIVTFKPSYTYLQRRKIFIEVLFICFIQTIIGYILGWQLYIVVSLISWFVSSTILISMIVTQHLRNPTFINSSDPVLTGTSVILPRWLDWLVDFHSFHTEHHIFPSINFDYYPTISKALQKKFPDRYNRMPFLKAIKESYEEEIFTDDPLL